MKEKWDIYNQYRQKTNTYMYRGDTLKNGQFHLVVHVCYINDQNQMLIQKRSSHKTWGGLWDISIGGAVQYGETSQQAAQRESFEELGIHHQFDDIRPQVSLSFERGFDDIYVIKKNIDIKQISFKDNEACDAKWATREEIYELIDQQLFLPIHHKAFIDFLFMIISKQS